MPPLPALTSGESRGLMLFRPATLQGIRDGTVTLAVRRWPRARVRVGGRQRTAIGVVAFDAVEATERDELDDEDARAAGFRSREELLAFVDNRQVGTIFRIRLRLEGPDPRVALRDALPSPAELREVERRLARLDRASRHGPWTRGVLEAIRDGPGVRAAELAERFGRETLPFKVDVRKLKELGLTESLSRGYRLSPRGRRVLEASGER